MCSAGAEAKFKCSSVVKSTLSFKRSELGNNSSGPEAKAKLQIKTRRAKCTRYGWVCPGNRCGSGAIRVPKVCNSFFTGKAHKNVCSSSNCLALTSITVLGRKRSFKSGSAHSRAIYFNPVRLRVPDSSKKWLFFLFSFFFSSLPSL